MRIVYKNLLAPICVILFLFKWMYFIVTAKMKGHLAEIEEQAQDME